MRRALQDWVDPRPAWRLLRQPLPVNDAPRRLARGVRLLAWMLLVVTLGIFTILVAFGLALASLIGLVGGGVPVLGALFDGMFYMLIAQVALGMLLTALLMRLAVTPVAFSYDRVVRGEPLPRWVALIGGLVALAAGLALPAAFLTVFFATTTAPILLGTFLGTLAAPFLVLSGVALLRARAPLVA